MVRRFLSSLILLFPFAGRAEPAPQPQAAPVLPAAMLEDRLKTFNEVWTLVNERHFDTTFGGLDWNAVREQYRPRVEQAANEKAFYELLNHMLGELKISHLQVIPPQDARAAAAKQEKAAPAPEGQPQDEAPAPKAVPQALGDLGMTLKLVDNQLVVGSVESGSPADQAGIVPGLQLKKVNGRPAPRQPAPWSVFGPAGAEWKGTLVDGDGKEIEAAAEFRPFPGQIEKMGEMPALPIFLEKRKLEGEVGYIRFNVFLFPLLEKIEKAIRSFRKSPGIIIDLRGNPGGLGTMVMPIARQLMDKDVSLGTMKMRKGETRFVVTGNPKAYAGKVAILVDEGSGSTSEILALGLQEWGRVRVIGTRTAGQALPSLFERLESGALLQFPIADFHTPKGQVVEGKGVTPDQEVPLDQKSLLSGTDPQLKAAVDYILSK